MKLVYIYGPPAVGKLTVAKEVEERTGFQIFDNHKTFDLAHELFDEINLNFWKLLHRIRLELIEEAAKRDVSMIMTNAYVNDEDSNEFIRNLKEAVESEGGEICFVKLSCEKEELIKRSQAESRQGTHKLTDPEEFREILEEHDHTEIPFVESLNIDNTDRPPGEVAEMIVEHFNLE